MGCLWEEVRSRSNTSDVLVADRLSFSCSAAGTGQCYGPQLGYTVPQSILSILGLSQQVATAAEKTILTLLVLHLVSAALSMIVFVLTLFLHSHVVAIIALIIAIATALLTSFMLTMDVVLIILLRNNMNIVVTGFKFNVEFGNAVWMILTAVLLSWFAVVMLSARACYCFGVRRYVLHRCLALRVV